MEILVRHDYTPKQVQRALLNSFEFKPTRYTSGSANLDNMIALGKAVILCAAHARKFSPKQARYLLHPAKHMKRVIGSCDVCKEYGFSSLFLNEKDAGEEQKKLEGFKRALEYSRFCAA